MVSLKIGRVTIYGQKFDVKSISDGIDIQAIFHRQLKIRITGNHLCKVIVALFNRSAVFKFI